MPWDYHEDAMSVSGCSCSIGSSVFGPCIRLIMLEALLVCIGHLQVTDGDYLEAIEHGTFKHEPSSS